MVDFDGSDLGLMQTLKQYPPAPQLLGLDLGCYTGRQALAMAPYCRTVAYDINRDYEEDALALMAGAGVQFSFQVANVLRLNFEPETVGVVSVGMTIYNSKSTMMKFLQKVMTWLSPNGILHVQFALVGDATEQSEFVQQGCIVDEGFEHSYVFLGLSCNGCNICFRNGCFGGSYWAQEEADQALLALDHGNIEIVYRDPQHFVRPSVGSHDKVSEDEFARAFYNVTAIKN